MKNDIKKVVSKSERRWALVYAVILMSITCLPYILGFARQGTDWRFTGFLFAVEDGNSYVAKMLSGSFGAWLFRTPYTLSPQSGLFMFVPYLVLGKLAKVPGIHEQLVVAYQFFRVGAGILSILASYDFLAFFLAERRLRRFGLVLVTIGGGLGWLLVLIGKDNWFGSLPLDFYSPETFGFLGLFGIPHLALARALAIWTLLSYLHLIYTAGGSAVPYRSIGKTALLWLLAGLAQPLALVTIGLALIIHLTGLALWKLGYHLLNKSDSAISNPNNPLPKSVNKVPQLALWVAGAGFLPLMLLFYNLWVMFKDPFARLWSAQNIILSPHPLHYLLAYGLLAPFAILGGWIIMKSEPVKGWLLVGWSLFLPILAYLPVNLQRRLPDGIWVAVVILALVPFSTQVACVINSGRGRQLKLPISWRFSLIYIFCLPSAVIILAGASLAAFNFSAPVFRPTEEAAAFQYLQQHAVPGSAVMASYETGNALPAWAPLRVVIGHGPESIGLDRLRPLVAEFYNANIDDTLRTDMVKHFNIRYVFWGPAERALGKWNPESDPLFERIFQSGIYKIFKVRE